MTHKDYIPSNVVTFLAWIQNAITYATEHSEEWGIAKPDEVLFNGVANLRELVEKCKEPTRSNVDIRDRNALRKIVEKAARNYLQGMVVRNPKVTDHDRNMMGLPIRDTTSTPIGNPVGAPSATVTYPTGGVLELHIVHVEGTPFDKRANYGLKIIFDVFPFDAPLPDDPDTLRRSVFTRRKRELVTFDKADAGKKAVFFLRYENSKGKAGQWGPPVSALIP